MEMPRCGESLQYRALGIAVLFGALVHYLVAEFFRPTPAYNAFVADTVFLVASALVLWQAFSAQRLGLHSSRGWLPVAALLLATAASTFLADDPAASWNRLKLYYACALFGAGFYLACRKDAARVVAPLLLAIALVHAWFLVELIVSIYKWAGKASSPQTVASNHFAHIRHFGYLGFLAACAGTGLFLLSVRLRLVSFALCVPALYGLIQFGSRGAFLAWAVFVLMLLVVIPVRKRFVLFCAAVVSVASLAVLYVDANHPLPNRKQQSVFTRSAVGEEQLETTRSRVELWNASLREIAKRPVFGLGPDAYVLSKCCPAGTVQPHNALVQFLFEFGLAGTLALSICIAWFLRRPLKILLAQRQTGTTDVALAVLTLLPVSLLLFSLVDGLLYHAVPLLHFTVLMALLGAVVYPRYTVATPSRGH